MGYPHDMEFKDGKLVKKEGTVTEPAEEPAEPAEPSEPSEPEA